MTIQDVIDRLALSRTQCLQQVEKQDLTRVQRAELAGQRAGLREAILLLKTLQEQHK